MVQEGTRRGEKRERTLQRLAELNGASVEEIGKIVENVAEPLLLGNIRPHPRGSRKKKDLEIRQALYDEGMTDDEIACEQGVQPAAIRMWRCKRGLEPNQSRKKETDMKESLTETNTPAAEATHPLSTEETMGSEKTEWDPDTRTAVRRDPFGPLPPPGSPDFYRNGDQMSVGMLAELLRKVAAGWPGAVVKAEDGAPIRAATLQIEFGPDGEEQAVELLLHEV